VLALNLVGEGLATRSTRASRGVDEPGAMSLLSVENLTVALPPGANARLR